MDPGHFGDFITKEYGLLKQILSYLQPRDLYNAQFVCRAWKNAAETLTEKNPVFVSFYDGQNEFVPSTVKAVFPDLVIYHNVILNQICPLTGSKFPRWNPKKCNICKQRFLVCPCKVIGSKFSFLSLKHLFMAGDDRVIDASECYAFCQTPSAVMLTSSKNVKITTLFGNYNTKLFTELVTEDGEKDFTVESEQIKCVLTICKNAKGTFTASNILNEVVDRQGLTFAVGGGISNGFYFKNKVNNDKPSSFIKDGVLFLIFRGDGVSAHSEVILSRKEVEIEQSMAELKRRAGEVPEGGYRVAFITQCVDRASEQLVRIENRIFRKYFPEVPQSGFRAWGEFGFKCGSSDNDGISSSKRRKLNFSHSYTTSIVILTFKKV